MTTEVTIDVYPSDTEITIQQRVAGKLNSVTKYISLDVNVKQITQQETATIDVVNILKFLKDKKDKNFKFYRNSDINEAIKKKLGKNFSLLDDIILPFIYFRVSDDESFAQTEYVDYASHVEKTMVSMGETPPKIDISNVVQKKKEFIAKLESDIADNKKGVEKFVEGYKKLEKLKGKPFTDFEVERIEVELVTNLGPMTIMEVFNDIVLTNDVPFASLNDYYKVFKGTIPHPLKSSEKGKIKLLIAEERVDHETEEKTEEEEEDELTLVTIAEKDDDIVIRMDLEVNNKRLKDVVVQKIVNLFPKISMKIVREKQIGVNGVFYFPKQVLDPTIFAHLMLNEVSFFKTLAINESEKSTKTKEGIYTYYNSGSEIVSSVITPKIVYSYDPTMRDKDRSVFPEGDHYVSVRISKAGSEKVVKKYQQTLSKIFSMYDIESKALIKMYKALLDPLGIDFSKATKGKVRTSTKVFLRKLIPEIFTSRYSRSCRKQPIIINEADKTKYANAILFPKTKKEGTQRWYACDHKEDKFVGLRINDPKSDYKFVPCCYKLDQKLDKNSWLNIYTKWKPGQDIDDECLVESDSAQQNITTTKKLARYGLFGNLKEFVEINTIFKNGNFLRRGMDRSRLSFLQCVFEANEGTYGPNSGNCKGRVDFLKNVLLEITEKDSLLNLTKQGFHSKSNEEIREILLNKNNYLDPRYLIPVLEYYFQCNIYVFTSDSLIVPVHLQNFLHISRDPTQKSIIILEHMGTEGENVIHPQCELIVRADVPSHTNVFADSDQITETVRHIFDDMCASYTMDKNVMYYSPEFGEYAKIYNQIINDYGKTNYLFLEFKDDQRIKVITLYSKTALPPFPVRNSKEEIALCGLETAMRFASLPFVVERKKVVSFGKIVAVEIRTNLDNTYFIPMMVADNDHYNLSLSTEKVSFPLENSFLSYFSNQRRVSHYILEYAKFLLSYFMYQGNHSVITNDILEKFVNASFILDSSYRYSAVPSKFGVVNEGFVRDSKIIINNNELLIRLLYVLSADYEKFEDYYMTENISQTFVDILDFQRHPSQILFYGYNTLLKFIKDSTTFHKLNSTILLQSKTPYFFRNQKIGEHVYLAFDVGSMTDALSYIHNWTTKGFAYNLPPISDKDEEEINVSVYNFVNEEEILPIHEAGSKDKVIVYSKENKMRFVVLIGNF